MAEVTAQISLEGLEGTDPRSLQAAAEEAMKDLVEQVVSIQYLCARVEDTDEGTGCVSVEVRVESEDIDPEDDDDDEENDEGETPSESDRVRDWLDDQLTKVAEKEDFSFNIEDVSE